MNLSYQANKEELTEVFAKFGSITDIEFPFRKNGKGMPLGIGFISFDTSEAKISAFTEMEKKFFQGRKLFIKPAEKKPPAPEPEKKVGTSTQHQRNTNKVSNQNKKKTKKEYYRPILTMKLTGTTSL